MAKKGRLGALRELLAGAQGKTLEHLAKKGEDLTRWLERDPEAPYRTGAPDGTPYDDILTHFYRLVFGANFLGDVIDCFEYQTSGNKSVRMARISTGRRIVEAICPTGVTITSGTSVRLNQHNQIVGLADGIPNGPVATVREVIPDQLVVEIAGATRSVHRGSLTQVSHGDRVVLDELQLVAMSLLPKDSQKFMLMQQPKHSFDDVVGHEEVVVILKEVIDHDPTADKVAQHYARPRSKGALLSGPPGCGKTMLGEAVAHRMAARYGKQALESGYFYVKGPEFLDKYVGDTEKGIRDCFEEAERHFKEHGFPAVLVFDECESLLSRRGDNHGVNMEKTVVPTFLGLMNMSSAFVMLMTNRADTLDPAVIRDGRIDRQLFIGRPTRASAELIIAKNLARYPIDPSGSSKEVLARIATDAFYDPKRRLISEGLKLSDGEADFTLGHIGNGAMFARLVQDAVLLAERRDRAHGTLSGVSEGDILTAVDSIFKEKLHLDHRDEIREFVTSFKDRMPDESQRQAMHG